MSVLIVVYLGGGILLSGLTGVVLKIAGYTPNYLGLMEVPILLGGIGTFATVLAYISC